MIRAIGFVRRDRNSGKTAGLGRDLDRLRASCKVGESVRVRAGEKDLAAKTLQRVEQSGSAPGIEMGGDLVEKDDRSDPRQVGDEPRMRKYGYGVYLLLRFVPARCRQNTTTPITVV